MKNSWSIQNYTWKTFGELAVTFNPLRIANIDPDSINFSCIYPHIWKTPVDKLCMPMSFHLQGRSVLSGSVRTRDISCLTLSAIYLQCSDARQNYFKIYWIFKFAVPLWLTHLRSDLVTTKDCSPTLHEYLLKYSDLHLEYFWRNSCYIYAPQNGQYWDAFPIFFLYLPPNLTDYCG